MVKISLSRQDRECETYQIVLGTRNPTSYVLQKGNTKANQYQRGAKEHSEVWKSFNIDRNRDCVRPFLMLSLSHCELWKVKTDFSWKGKIWVGSAISFLFKSIFSQVLVQSLRGCVTGPKIVPLSSADCIRKHHVPRLPEYHKPLERRSDESNLQLRLCYQLHKVLVTPTPHH